MVLVHKHLIIRAEVKNPPTSETYIKNWARELVQAINMKICAGPISEYVDMPGNKGLTCVTIIETSHIAIHVWDEPDPALMQIDVYTCGPFDPNVVFDKIRNSFDPVSLEYKYLDREHGLTEVEV